MDRSRKQLLDVMLRYRRKEVIMKTRFFHLKAGKSHGDCLQK